MNTCGDNKYGTCITCKHMHDIWRGRKICAVTKGIMIHLDDPATHSCPSFVQVPDNCTSSGPERTWGDAVASANEGERTAREYAIQAEKTMRAAIEDRDEAIDQRNTARKALVEADKNHDVIKESRDYWRDAHQTLCKNHNPTPAQVKALRDDIVPDTKEIDRRIHAAAIALLGAVTKAQSRFSTTVKWTRAGGGVYVLSLLSEEIGALLKGLEPKL